MRLMLATLCVLLSFSTNAVNASGQVTADEEELPTMTQIYASYLEENGGLRNIQRINSMKIRGNIIGEAEKPLPFKLYRKKPNLLRISVELDNYELDTVYNGKRGWKEIETRKGFVTTEVTGDELKELKQDSSIESPFFKLAQRLENLSLIGMSEVNGVTCFEIQIEDEKSPYTKIWLSEDHFQEVKIARRNTPKDTKIRTIVFSKFDRKEGIWAAHRIDHYTDGKIIRSVTVDAIRINAGIYSSFFDPRD